MKHLGGLAQALLLVVATAAVGQATSSPPQRAQAKASSKVVHTTNPDRGQQVFKENCSRCHNEPEGFSPSISGTIARHMRVRANLSDADYKALLRFLNP
jgi:cytochrome c5